MTRDPHAVLGVARDADAAQIRQAYRRLAKRLHPDVEGGDDRRFAELQDAYARLVAHEETPARNSDGPLHVSIAFSIRLGRRRR